MTSSFDSRSDDKPDPESRQVSALVLASKAVPVRLQGLHRPMTLAVVASLCVHLLLMAGGWPAAAPNKPVPRHLGGPTMPVITATLELSRPISSSGFAQMHARPTGTTGLPTHGEKSLVLAAPSPLAGPPVSRTEAPVANQPVAPELDAELAAVPTDSATDSDAESAAASAASVAPQAMALPSGWGRRSSWGQAESAWQYGARELARIGQAQIDMAQQRAHHDAPDRARGHYDVTWHQRLAELPLGGTCAVTFTAGQLPSARCDDAADEASVDALAIELGLVPA